MADLDLLVHNARVFDGTGVSQRLGAVGVRGRRIVAVGDVDARARATIDAEGALVHPAFTDAHVHPAQAGVELLACDLAGAGSASAALERVRRYAAEHPERDWILGAGWQLTWFGPDGPHARLLDDVAPGRAVVLTDTGHHAAWMSTEALRRVGIDTSTPDPPDGRIQRDARGEPTGVVHEGAMELGRHRIPVPTPAELADGILAAQRVLFGVGVTGWQDAIVGDYAGSVDSTAGYHLAARSGGLRARATAALWLDRSATRRDPRDVAHDLAERRRLFESVGDGQLTAPAVKVMLDGVVEARTAALKQPYTDAPTPPGHFTVDELTPLGVELARAGFQLHFHAIGDAALATALDVVEAAHRVRRLRHHVAHLQIVDPVDIPRMARLGVTANLQMLWAANDEQNVSHCRPALGDERYLSRQFPFGSLAAAGVHLAGGSDWPVTTPDPWQAISVAVTRVLAQDPAEPLAPEEALPLDVALRAHTRGSAEIVGDVDGGCLEPGARADLVLLDRDPFRLDPSELHRVRAVGTWVGGERVHDAT